MVPVRWVGLWGLLLPALAAGVECDVLVLGAGLAGTSAAWRLVGERPVGAPQPRVCLIEASDRIGGRTKDHTVCGQTVELGAQWIAQREVDADVWDLAVDRLDLGVYNGWPWALYGFPVGPAGRDPAVERWLDRVPPASSPGLSAADTFFGPNASGSRIGQAQAGAECQRRMAELYTSVVLGQPWETPGAERLDAVTPLELLRSVGCNITKEDLIAQGLNQVNLQHPTSLPPAFWISITSASSSGQEIFWRGSALWWLHSVKSNSGTISMAVDVQNYRIVGGVQQMSVRLVHLLEQAGAVVKLSSPVRKIRYTSSSVEFVTSNGESYVGKYAIITGTPVALSAHVSWEPALPPGVALMLKSAHIGNYNKHYALFEQGPVWRANRSLWEDISARQVMWPMVYQALPPLPADSQQDPNGTCFFPTDVIDNSPLTLPTERCPRGLGALFSFGWPGNGSTAAARADGWYKLLEGVPGLPRPSSVVGQAWAEEPYVMGAYGAWWPPNVLSRAREQFGAVPGGRVFFGGSEWSPKGAGYMNGAVHNGRRHGDIVAELLRQEAFN